MLKPCLAALTQHPCRAPLGPAGGKVDAGEGPEAALVRELHEELGIAVAAADLQPLTFASHAYPAFHRERRRRRGQPVTRGGAVMACHCLAQPLPTHRCHV